MPALITASDISRRYPGVIALDSVTFEIQAGEVHALVGENGAGKSTLMKILGGIEAPDSGVVRDSDGEPLRFDGPRDAQNAGIALIHQELNLVPDLSVAANVFLGREPRRGPFPHHSEMERRARELLERLGSAIDPRERVANLSLAQAQLVEIAKALSIDAQVLIMDEPTAALADSDADHLFTVIRDFLSPRTAVVFISHRLDEVQAIAHRTSVMRDGKLVWSGVECTRESLISHMVGRAVDFSARPDGNPRGQILLDVSHVATPAVKDVSFSVREGEIFGIAGLVGSGRTELLRAIGGADEKRGSVLIRGREVATKTPEEAVASGVGYLSEDRKHLGLLLEDTVTANIALPSLALSSRFGVVDDAAHRATAERYRDELRIKIPGVEERAKNLSGGNQQKVVLAKWLARDLEVLLVDEPTRGVDVGAKEEIYRLLEELAHEGKAIVVVSSEIAELQRLAHRIGVMCEGRLTGIMHNQDATQERVMELATMREIA